MNRTLIPIDISSQPDIRRLAEEVQASKTPRVLKRNNESIAVVMPLAPAISAQGTNIWEKYNAKRVQDALRESAGALVGVDKEALLNDIKAARTQDTQQPL